MNLKIYFYFFILIKKEIRKKMIEKRSLDSEVEKMYSRITVRFLPWEKALDLHFQKELQTIIG
jgi:hypothetical protein